MYADAIRIHVGEAAEPVDTHHLVLHLLLAAVTVDGLLKGRTAVGRAPVVLDINQIALLGHEHLPHADLPQPGILHQLGVRASINVEDDRILPLRIEILGID